MIKTKTNISVKNVNYINVWSELSFNTLDGEISIELTDSQMEELSRRLVKKVEEKRRDKLERMKEELEESQKSESDS